MTTNRFILIISILLTGLMSACDDNDKKCELYLIGDSIVARFDADEMLNFAVTHNLGISGSGINYLKELRGTQSNHDVVILSGTNDLVKLNDESAMLEYASDYVETIKALNARKIYLFSILPRRFKNENDFNPRIKQLNGMIYNLVKDDPLFVYMNVYDDFIKDGHIDYDLYSDGLHLSTQGYEILSSTLRKHL